LTLSRLNYRGRSSSALAARLLPFAHVLNVHLSIESYVTGGTQVWMQWTSFVLFVDPATD
jgi:hypothetical protein